MRSQADTHRAVEDCEVARQVLVHMIENLPGKMRPVRTRPFRKSCWCSPRQGGGSVS